MAITKEFPGGVYITPAPGSSLLISLVFLAEIIKQRKLAISAHFCSNQHF